MNLLCNIRTVNKVNNEHNLTELEHKILLQLHLQGFWGKSGNLSKQSRLIHLNKLTHSGYLDENCKLTNKAIIELDNKHKS